MTDEDADLEGDKLLFDDEVPEKKESSASGKKSKSSTKRQKAEHSKKFIESHDSGISINYKNMGKFFYERLVYIIIIVVLIAVLLLFKNPISFNFGGNGTDVVDNSTSVVGASTQTPDAGSNVADTVFWAEDGSDCKEVDVLYNGKSYSTKQKCLNAIGGVPATGSGDNTSDYNCASGTVKVSIVSINVDEDNLKKIDSVKIKIENNANSILDKFYADLIWYNSDTEADIKYTPKLKESSSSAVLGKYPFIGQNIAKCGGTKTIILDSEIASHYVSTREIKNTFDIRLYNYSSKKDKLTSGSKTLFADD